MKELNIEWLHFETGRETCLRCSETGKTLDHVITCLKHELKSKGVEVTFTETLLPESQMAHSNEILFNNVPLEEKDGQMVITDATRIVETLPTLRLLSEQGGKLILTAHLGRPKGKREATMSLRPVAAKRTKKRDSLLIPARVL